MEIIKPDVCYLNRFKYFGPFPIFFLLPSLLFRIFPDTQSLIKSCASEIFSQSLLLRNQTWTFHIIPFCPRREDTHLLNLYGKLDNCCSAALVLFFVYDPQQADDNL